MFNNKLISTPPKKISLFYNSKTRERDAVYNAIERSQAVIEFTMDGTIINANKNFLDAMGYTLDEVIGRHHSIFVDPHYAQSRELRVSGRISAAGSMPLLNINALAKAEKRYGYRRATIPSLI